MSVFLILMVASCYLVGSVPTAFILVKLLKGVDVRTVGSGNVGATNAGRVLGKPGFVAVLILDSLKGFLPVIGSLYLCGKWGVSADFALLSGVAVILGHAFPIFLKFSGGKGVATGLGVFLAVAPVPLFIGVGVFVAVVFIWRMVSLGSCLAALAILIVTVALPASYALWGLTKSYALWSFTAAVAAFVIVKHKSNIERILAGTENKVFAKK